MLYTANKTGGGQSVGSLQDICIGTVLSNGGEKLLGEKIPGVVTRHVSAKGSCLLPYCINTRLTICTERCNVKDNICSLITSRPYPFIYLRAFNEYGMGKEYRNSLCAYICRRLNARVGNTVYTCHPLLEPEFPSLNFYAAPGTTALSRIPCLPPD
jgi:hypothetical protein